MSILHFEVTKETKKTIIGAIEKATGEKAKYQGVPSCAYRIGAYTLNKDGSLTWEDADTGIELDGSVVDACVMAGFEPSEWANLPHEEPLEEGAEIVANAEEIKPEIAEPEIQLGVSLPRNLYTDAEVENIKAIVGSKETILCHALSRESLPVEVTDETITFNWFETADPDEVQAYTHLVSAICEMAKSQKRITAKEKEVDNEKYAFRCFLLRLGFIGDEYKKERKILLKNLTGSAAFKAGKKGE